MFQCLMVNCYLAKPVAKFAAAYPDVIVDVDFDDKRIRLIEEV